MMRIRLRIYVFVLLLCLLPVSRTAKQPELSRCTDLRNTTDPEKYFSYRNNIYPVTLGVSKSLTHQLTTEIFKIFLLEVVGYHEVKIEPMNETEGIYSMLDQMTPNRHMPPKIDIALEIIVPVGLNLAPTVAAFDTKECGEVGHPIRYEWTTPIEKPTTSNFSILLLYSMFKNYNESIPYSLDEQDIFALNKSGSIVKPYVPKWCLTKSNCATLIASNPLDTKFIVEDINKMGLYVNVLWLGDNFRSATTDLLKRYPKMGDNKSTKSFLILGHSLETMVFQDYDFTTIKFPQCDYYYGSNETCNYMNRRVVKLASVVFMDAADAAYEALSYVQFSADDYLKMTKYYLDHASDPNAIYNTACSWMKNHSHDTSQEKINGTTYESWTARNDHTVRIMGIFPLSVPVFEASSIVGAAELATVHITNSKLLQPYNLDLLVEDGACSADMVMRSFISNVRNQFRKLVGIVGPACSEAIEALAGVVKHFDTVIISYGAEGSGFSDRKKYPNFFRTIGDNGQFKYVYQELFKFLNWKRIASLSEDGTKYTEYVSQTQDLLLKDGVTFVASKKFGTSLSTDPEKIKEYLLEFKSKEARIIIADVDAVAAKALMCEAFYMNMTAKHGFVWFLPSWLAGFWLHSDLNHSATSSGNNCTSQQIKEAIDAHLTLSHAFLAEDNTITSLNNTKTGRNNSLTVADWKKELANKTGKIVPNDFSGYAYDAVWVLALALKELMMENAKHMYTLHSPSVSQKLIEYIHKVNFSGVTGHINFGNGSTRNNMKVNIYQWDAFNTEMHRVSIATYDPLAPKSKRFVMQNKIRWLTEGGKVPWDGTREDTCIVEGLASFLNAECQTALIVANIIVFALVLLLVLSGFLIIKRKYDKKARLAREYQEALGLLVPGLELNSLDKWEIPKDLVVINRKLGEGAFGMVYGGETFFNEKGWVAVAVKTLKVGSTASEKLDFLSEADVMKQFEHKNIVQLLGVCTQSEPVYTIMEFMLYGDLKTFLLARRHLANDNQREDNEDVSSKRLTSMALDIARALSYLADIKYVHRDVASRNCLVNASRVAKLGDFGMTRPMCDHDYYKFNRKGFLPVRWMAPESLGLGVFTPASDIWSYGVLLYEIITFGNFPFQGMTNTEVLDFVKAGNTLSVPSGVKLNLEGLIRSCWSIESLERPTASQIVDFLGNNPRIITPCLDVPLSSVPAMEDNMFGVNLPEGNTRKFSMSLRHRTSASPSTENHPWTDVSEPLLPLANGWHKMPESDSIVEDGESGHNANFPL